MLGVALGYARKTYMIKHYKKFHFKIQTIFILKFVSKLLMIFFSELVPGWPENLEFDNLGKKKTWNFSEKS